MDDVSPETWIVIPEWDRFQHYKDRDPTWIKTYVRLLHNPGYLELSMASRGLLHGLWLAYAAERQDLSYRKAIAILGKPGIGPIQLKALNHAGFIEFSASKPLAHKKEKEKDPQTPADAGASVDTKKKTRRRSADGRRITGWKMVRGSHGSTTIPDPDGVDPAP